MQMMQQQAMQTAVLQQHAAMTRRARRLHVGNLPQGLSIEALKELFNTTMSAAKLTLDESPCVNDVHMAPDARFCFVEFRSAHEASNALVLDGMQASATTTTTTTTRGSAPPPPPLPTHRRSSTTPQLLDRNLRVARPNDFTPAPPELHQTIIPQAVSATVTSSTMPQACAGMGLMTNPAAMKPAVPAAGGSLAGLSGASLASMATLHGGAGLLNAAGQNQFAGQLGGALGGQNALAASRRARRLHIGNLPQGVGLDAQMLKQFFNAALVSASLHDTSKEGDPVLDTMIAGEGKFGFVEFRTIAEAISCLALNGIELGGKQLRIERPRDYTPMPDSMHEELKAAGVMGSTSVAPDGKDLLNPATAASAAPANLTVGGAPLAALTGPAAGAACRPSTRPRRPRSSISRTW